MNRKRRFRMPADRVIPGCHCLTVETEPQKSDQAPLFLFGDGMIIGPDAGNLKMVWDMGQRSGREDCAGIGETKRIPGSMFRRGAVWPTGNI